jgi:hypothetical protein
MTVNGYASAGNLHYLQLVNFSGFQRQDSVKSYVYVISFWQKNLYRIYHSDAISIGGGGGDGGGSGGEWEILKRLK